MIITEVASREVETENIAELSSKTVELSLADVKTIIDNLPILEELRPDLEELLNDEDAQEVVSVTIQLAITKWWREQVENDQTVTWNQILQKIKSDSTLRSNLARSLDEIVYEIKQEM